MATEEKRLTRLEEALETLRPSLHERLEKLEAAAEEKPKNPFLRFIEWMGPALPQLITGAVILGIAFLAKDSVDLAIKRQQVQLSYAKEMNEQLNAMAAPDATLEEIKRAAVLIATFGQPSLMPLMNELRHGGNRALGAEDGLRSLAFMKADAVCDVVPKIVGNPARMLGWEGHMVAGRILAVAGCGNALELLVKHRQLIDAGDKSIATIVYDTPVVLQKKEWKRSLDQSIAALSPP